MANIESVTRSNYFRVKDPEAFREFMGLVYGSENSICMMERTDKAGTTYFGFGVYGGIAGIKYAKEDEEEDVDETAYDEFIEGLQQHVAEDDAVIIFDIANEKLRYVMATACIITHTAIHTMDLTHEAVCKAGEMLFNPDYQTSCEY